MNRDIIEGNWKQFTGKVKAQWGKFTGHPFDEIDGNSTEVSGRIQEGYGISMDAIEQQIELLKKRNKH